MPPKLNKYPAPYHWIMSRYSTHKYLYPLEVLAPYLKKGLRVLDLGCGDARRTVEMAKMVREVVGLENQEKPLKFARIILEDMSKVSKKITLALYDGKHIPYPENSFDVVTAFDVIEHLPRTAVPSWLKEIHRVLRPGGVFIILTPNRRMLTDRIWGIRIAKKHYYEYTTGEIHAILTKAGLTVEKTFGIYLPPPLRGVEHYASIFPIYFLFDFLIRAGKPFPNLAESFVMVAHKEEDRPPERKGSTSTAKSATPK